MGWKNKPGPLVKGAGIELGGTDPDMWRQVAEGGQLKLQKNIAGTWTNIHVSDEDGTIIATAVRTGVGSFHLGEYHSFGSGGQNFLVINHETNLAFYPGVWQAESLDGTTVIEPVTRVMENSLVTGAPNGAARNGVPVSYQFTLVPTVPVAFYSVKVRLEEAAPNGFTWLAVSASGKEFMRKHDPSPRLAGAVVNVQFDYQIYLKAGDVANISLFHGREGAIVKCTAGTTVPGEPWRETKSRRFIEVPLNKSTQSITIPAGSDNTARHVLARPESKILRIWGTTPSVANKTIQIHAGAKLYESYLLIGTISATGAGEAFSIDVEVPLGYKYIYFKKDFTDSVNAMTINVEAF